MTYNKMNGKSFHSQDGFRCVVQRVLNENTYGKLNVPSERRVVNENA